ncbi:transcriptional regulator, TetR family [Methylobacterium sp. 4-46]|uniref:TetR/AcrR family transcriptional regulator n=1 Tax=unclassified Methylobacterium TaxID=2615210 RepID=UPI000152CE88|nr:MULTISPECIES: TetR/AcrR family transcriptional regulator [Methylobacterium]ACA19017.1 transcriptional regulator, TetR family [Methylobacterium sp. 4-46]WFT78231.1 TetR/AcrR family transcriptional regulator [Methylobacterium nodulans]
MSRTERQQQARSVATRERLVRAALDEIFEVGYHAATTQQIAERARVSRGALLHHFPTRADIILAAMEVLLADGTAEIKAVSADVRSGALPLADFVEFLWQLFSGRFFYLSMEMITEARHDPALRRGLIPVVQRFHAALDAIWVEFCDGERRPPREARIILNLTVNLVRGMGVQTVLRPEPDYYRDMIEAWKSLLPQLIAGPAGDAAFAGPRFRAAGREAVS